MGRLRKRFNEKGRQKKDIRIQHSADEKIAISDDLKRQQQDNANALVLPNKKRKTKDVTKAKTTVKLLSKRQRKKLEQIVQRKEKKQKRAGLLEQLQRVQGDSVLLSQLTSVAGAQTAGLKRVRPPRAVGGVKRLRCPSEHSQSSEEAAQDPNVIGTEVVAESDSSDDEESDSSTGNAGEVHQLAACEPSPEPQPETPAADAEPTHALSTETKPAHTPSTETKPAQRSGSGRRQTRTTQSGAGMQHVPVLRTQQIEEARLRLPILAEEQVIVETIHQHPVTVLAGETGSGKTTQVPQFLYEAGYARDCMIGVTEPRRVAAVSMSRRVAEEMSLGEDTVSYQIRFEGNASDSTRIKFMTDGVLMKEIETDFLLSKYSVIILDEAHERSVYTDILVGLLSRIVPVRARRGRPLKLVIMSATLRVSDFTENARLFPTPPPVIQVESRQFPVTVHWSKRTPDDYLSEAFRKACKIHSTLPDGGILIFLTGQAEVTSMVHRLRRAFPAPHGCHQQPSPQQQGRSRTSQPDPPETEPAPLTEAEQEELFFNPKLVRQQQRRNKAALQRQPALPDIDLDSYAVMPPGEEADDVGGSSDSDIDSDSDSAEGGTVDCQHPLMVLPLYALLPTDRQQQVFAPVPAGTRLCVVATNVAETSLTIPGIKYIIDTGRVKQKLYDKTSGVSAFTVMQCSQAAANQRAGRAGRVSPGHCYRLYSSALFNDEMPQFTPPEMQRRPVQDVLLLMKAMYIDRVRQFPFPSPPDRAQLTSAERTLLILGALERTPGKDGTPGGGETRVTPLGRVMSSFPVSPRYAKMLALSQQHGLMPYTVCLVSALTVQQLLLESAASAPEAEPNGQQQQGRRWDATRRAWAGTGHSLLLGDPAVLIRAVGAAEHAGATPEFCARHGLRQKAVREIRRLRVQLSSQVSLSLPSAAAAVVDPRQPPPSQQQCALLRQLMLAALPDHVARRVEPDEIKNAEQRPKWKHAYRCTSIEEPVFLHRSSVLRRHRPQFVVYQEVYQTNKLYMRGVTAVEPEWLPVLCPDLCTFGSPLPEPAPRYDPGSGRLLCQVPVTFGPLVWPLPICERELPAGGERYRRLALHLLSGHVCPRLAPFSAALLAPADTMVKSWARLHPRTETLLRALVDENCDNRDRLINVWRDKPNYLLAEYQQWLPEVLHQKVTALWPPCATPEDADVTAPPCDVTRS